MPRKVTAYACSWNCRRNVITSRMRMAEHEKRCKLNPARKACPTCRHEDNDEDTGYYCDIEKVPEGQYMVYDCDYWEPKEEEDCNG